MNKQEFKKLINIWRKNKNISGFIYQALINILNAYEPTISEVKKHCIVEGCDYCTFKNDCQVAHMCPQGWDIEAITKVIKEKENENI